MHGPATEITKVRRGWAQASCAVSTVLVATAQLIGRNASAVSYACCCLAVRQWTVCLLRDFLSASVARETVMPSTRVSRERQDRNFEIVVNHINNDHQAQQPLLHKSS